MKNKIMTYSVLAALTISSLSGCNGQSSQSNSSDNKVKAAFICIHDENSTYDMNFIEAAREACHKLDIEYVIKTNIPVGQECYDTATALAEEGYNYIFADSYGHEDYIIQAAKEYPEVEFCHATGTKAHTEGLANYHNAFASVYDSWYLTGIAAGMKLNEMIDAGTIKAEDAKLGFVGSYTYAEVISGYTAYYLGAKSVCPTASMDVTFTGYWYNEEAEQQALTELTDDSCVVISENTDSMSIPLACEAAGIPNISYNANTNSSCPNTFVISSKINWEPYFTYSLSAHQTGKEIVPDWVGHLGTGAIEVSAPGKNAAAGTEESITQAKADLANEKIHVFDNSTFTVDGQTIDSYQADIDTDDEQKPDHEAMTDGYFNESDDALRSAPYFDLKIDGITLLNEKY